MDTAGSPAGLGREKERTGGFHLVSESGGFLSPQKSHTSLLVKSGLSGLQTVGG